MGSGMDVSTSPGVLSHGLHARGFVTGTVSSHLSVGETGGATAASAMPWP